MKQLKKVMFSLLVIIMLLCTFIIKTEVKAQTSTEPQLTVYKNNVSYKDSVYFMYAVSYENIDITQYDIELLFWNTKQDTYTKGTEKYYKEVSRTQTVTGVDCVIYYSEGIAAKNIVDDIYTRAYVKIGDKEYYSEVNKTSVVDYLLRMIEGGTLNTNQKNLFNALLAYGAAAQNNFDYKTDQLATEKYYKINVVDGLINKEFTEGRYKKNTTITISANEKEGSKFIGWSNKNGIIISEDKEIQIKVTENNTYTANYKDVSTISKQLKMQIEVEYDTLSSDLELPYAVIVEKDGEEIELAITWDRSQFNEKIIGKQTIFASLTDESLYDEYGINTNEIQMEINVLPYTFEIDTKTQGYAIVKYYGNEEKIETPNVFNNKEVTTIRKNAFYNLSCIKELVISDNVRKIEQQAIYLCDNIEKITLPVIDTYLGYYFGASSSSDHAMYLPLKLKEVVLSKKVTTIGYDAFYKCTSLTNITIPNSVTSIGSRAFAYCTSLTNIAIPNNVTSIESGVFENCTSLTNITIPNSVASIGVQAFYNCTSLTNITIPNSVTSIGNSAFYNCTSLESIEIPNSITSIGSYVFDYCTNLKKVYMYDIEKLFTMTANSSPLVNGADLYINNQLVTNIEIPSNITKINAILSGWTKLESITISSDVTNIGSSAFKNCINLRKVKFEEGSKLESIGSSAFSGCISLESIIIPNSVTSIGSSAFSNCTALTNIEIPNSVTSIGSSAFSNCTSLINITIPNSVTNIGSAAFSNCTSLENITLSNFIRIINSDLFRNCNALTNITIPNSVTSINDYAFRECTSLTNITIPNSVTSIEDYAFYNCKNLFIVYNNSDLILTPGSSEYGYVAYYAYKVINKGNIIYRDGTTVFEYFNVGDFKFLNHNNEYYLVSYLGDDAIPEVPVLKINGKVVNYSFQKIDSSLKNIKLAYGFTSIVDSAFYNCTSLESVEIPNSVTSIGSHAFYDCTSLTNITIPNSVTSIGSSAFSGCTSLESITIPNSVTSIKDYAFSNCTSLTNVTIPNSVTSIGRSAFSYCTSLTNITIPNSVTSIGTYAFSYCTSLTNITIPNSVTSINDYAFRNCTSLKTIYNFSSLNFTKGSSNYGYIALYAENIIKCYDEYILELDVSYDTTVSIIEKHNNFNITVGNNTYALTVDWDTTSFVEGKIGEQVLNGSIVSLETIKINNIKLKVNILPYTYIVSGDETILTKYMGTENEVNILNGITIIGERAFENNTKITKVNIPSSVKTIESWAFTGCEKLENVSFKNANNICVIEEGAFSYCYSLTEFILSANLTEIADSLFYYCKSLEAITIPNNIKSIGERAFFHCESLTEIIISNNVETIGAYAFDNCQLLEKVQLSETLTTIGDHTFNECFSLSSITIPSGVTTIGSYAFYGCETLVEVVNNSDLELTIGTTEHGFVAYYALELNNKGVITYKNNSEKYETITTEDGFTFINNNGIYYLTSYSGDELYPILPNEINGNSYSIQYIDSTLKDITLPTGMTLIEEGQFNSNLIETIIIPEGVVEIGEYAFYSMPRLKEVRLPSTLETIGNSAFYNCYNLKTIYNYSSIELVKWTTGNGYIAQYANAIYSKFIDYTVKYDISYDTTTESLILPTIITVDCEGVNVDVDVTWDKTDFDGSLSTQTLKGEITDMTVLGGYGYYIVNLYIELNKSNYSFIINNNEITITKYHGNNEEVVIPNKINDLYVTSIGEYAFSNCTSLENVYYNGTIEDWCKITFNWSSSNPMYYASNIYMLDNNNEYYEVKEIEIPNTITTIGDYQFYGFKSVTNVIIPNSVTSIGRSAFYNCTSLESIEIPNSVTSIGSSAFRNCTSLTNITIPNSVTSIGGYAFYNCKNLFIVFNNSDLIFTIGSSEYGYIAYYAYKVINKGNIIYRDGTTAYEYFNVGDFKFLNHNNKYYLLSYLGNDAIPEVPVLKINGNVVDYSFQKIDSSLKNIKLSNEFTSIVNSAFYDCTLLESVEIPNSVTSIGSSAFENCTLLTNITIPNSVTSIGSLAFYNCTSLENVYYEGTIENWCSIYFATASSNPLTYANHFYIKNSNGDWEEVNDKDFVYEPANEAVELIGKLADEMESSGLIDEIKYFPFGKTDRLDADGNITNVMPLPKKVSELTSALAEYADLEIVWIAHEEGLLDENYKLLKQYLRYHEVVLTYTVTVEGIQASGEVVINVGITEVKNTIYLGGNWYQQSGTGEVSGDVLSMLSKFDSPVGVLGSASKTWGYSYGNGQFQGTTWYVDVYETDENGEPTNVFTRYQYFAHAHGFHTLDDMYKIELSNPDDSSTAVITINEELNKYVGTNYGGNWAAIYHNVTDHDIKVPMAPLSGNSFLGNAEVQWKNHPWRRGNVIDRDNAFSMDGWRIGFVLDGEGKVVIGSGADAQFQTSYDADGDGQLTEADYWVTIPAGGYAYTPRTQQNGGDATGTFMRHFCQVGAEVKVSYFDPYYLSPDGTSEGLGSWKHE